MNRITFIILLSAALAHQGESRPSSFQAQANEILIGSRTMPAGSVGTFNVELAAADSIIAAYAEIRFDSMAIDVELARSTEIPGVNVQLNSRPGIIRIAGAGTSITPVAIPGQVVKIAELEIRVSGTPGDTLELIPWILKIGEGAPEPSAGPIAEVILSEALPVELVDFWGSIDGDVVSLSWQTTSELNSDRFDVVRFADHDLAQVVVASIPAAGESDGVIHYTVRDTVSGPGRYHYLLRQFDFDQWFTIYGPVSLSSIQFEPAILGSPFPNPSAGRVSMSAGFAVSSFARIELFDILGRRLGSMWEGYTDAQSRMIFRFDIDEPAGLYFIRIAGSFGERVFPITITR